MTERRWPIVVVTLTLAGVLSGLGYGVFSVVHTPSDADMLNRFHAHRASFDQLLHMFVEDKQDMFIATLGRSSGHREYPRLGSRSTCA